MFILSSMMLHYSMQCLSLKVAKEQDTVDKVGRNTSRQSEIMFAIFGLNPISYNQSEVQ